MFASLRYNASCLKGSANRCRGNGREHRVDHSASWLILTRRPTAAAGGRAFGLSGQRLSPIVRHSGGRDRDHCGPGFRRAAVRAQRVSAGSVDTRAGTASGAGSLFARQPGIDHVSDGERAGSRLGADDVGAENACQQDHGGIRSAVSVSDGRQALFYRACQRAVFAGGSDTSGVAAESSDIRLDGQR
jgi:hypothetical protein